MVENVFQRDGEVLTFWFAETVYRHGERPAPNASKQCAE
jgi:hypothetical protein